MNITACTIPTFAVYKTNGKTREIRVHCWMLQGAGLGDIEVVGMIEGEGGKLNEVYRTSGFSHYVVKEQEV